jgi:hypothetical protein
MPDYSNTYSRPLNYDQLILEQLQRVAQDYRGEIAEERTIKNIQALHYLTKIDHDEQYVAELNKLMDTKQRENNQIDFNVKTKGYTRGTSDMQKMKTDYNFSVQHWGIIMDCLKRAGRFPARLEQSFEGEDDKVVAGTV